MRRLLALGLGLALLAAGAAAVTLSALADEGRSAFVAGGAGADALVRDARDGSGVGARRLLTGPLGIGLDGSLEPRRTLLAIVSPGDAYTPDEVDAVRGFLEAGGQVLVADAFGDGGSLTVPFGIAFERVRLVEAPGSQPVHQMEGRRFPLTLTAEATALHLDPQLAPAARVDSSADSFLDRGGDGIIDASDPHGPFPLLAEVAVGENGGRLLAVSDPGLLAPGGSDGMGTWRRALLAHLLPEGGVVLVDESHPRAQDPLLAGASAVLAAARTPLGKWVLSAIAVLILAAAAIPTRPDDWRRHRFRPHRFLRRADLAARARDRPKLALGGSGWTRRGVAAVAGAPALAVLAVVLGHRELAWAAAMLAVAASAALLHGPPRVDAVRHLSARQVAEESSLVVAVDLSPRGRGSVDLEILDELPEEFDVQSGSNWFRTRLGPGGAHVPYTVSPALRGPYAVGPLMARRIDPLHLHVRQATCETPERVEVSPRREKLNKVPFGARVPSITLGPHNVNRAGEGSEFHSLREYHEGDSFRSINWRASARSRNLVVSQRVHESMTTVTLLLDARALAAAGPASTSPIAQACRNALSLAAGSLQVRDRVRFIAYGDGVRELPPAPASRQVHEIVALLAGLDAGGSMTLKECLAKIMPTLKPGNPIILLSGLEGDATIPEGMRLLRGRGLLPMVIAPPLGVEPKDPEDGGPEPGTDAVVAQRKAAIAGLRSSGIPVYETVPGVPLDYMFRLGVAG